MAKSPHGSPAVPGGAVAALWAVVDYAPAVRPPQCKRTFTIVFLRFTRASLEQKPCDVPRSATGS